jgi:hypothetical protein
MSEKPTIEARVTDLEYAVFGNDKMDDEGLVKTVTKIDTNLTRISYLLRGIIVGVGIQLASSLPEIFGVILKLFGL